MQRTTTDSGAPTDGSIAVHLRAADVGESLATARSSQDAGAKMRCLYKEHYLVAMSSGMDDGRYQARVAAMVLCDSRTHSQRFLDFETFGSRQEADTFAIEAGKAWVDRQLRESPGCSPTNYASF